jgi:hypothetical protein
MDQEGKVFNLFLGILLPHPESMDRPDPGYGINSFFFPFLRVQQPNLSSRITLISIVNNGRLPSWCVATLCRPMVRSTPTLLPWKIEYSDRRVASPTAFHTSASCCCWMDPPSRGAGALSRRVQVHSLSVRIAAISSNPSS